MAPTGYFFAPSEHTMRFEVTPCKAPAAGDGKTWCWCHWGEVILRADVWGQSFPRRRESSGRSDSLGPSNSKPDGVVQSGIAIVAAWIPAFAGMTALQMTPVLSPAVLNT